MTSDDLRAYLDAHGVDGAPAAAGWYAVERSGRDGVRLDIAHWMMDAYRKRGRSNTPRGITRHAPLPDFAAMARELEELRARVEDLGMRARVGCGDCLGTGEGEDAPCDACDGEGWVYRRRADRETP